MIATGYLNWISHLLNRMIKVKCLHILIGVILNSCRWKISSVFSMCTRLLEIVGQIVPPRQT